MILLLLIACLGTNVEIKSTPTPLSISVGKKLTISGSSARREATQASRLKGRCRAFINSVHRIGFQCNDLRTIMNRKRTGPKVFFFFLFHPPADGEQKVAENCLKMGPKGSQKREGSQNDPDRSRQEVPVGSQDTLYRLRYRSISSRGASFGGFYFRWLGVTRASHPPPVPLRSSR